MTNPVEGVEAPLCVKCGRETSGGFESGYTTYACEYPRGHYGWHHQEEPYCDWSDSSCIFPDSDDPWWVEQDSSFVPPSPEAVEPPREEAGGWKRVKEDDFCAYYEWAPNGRRGAVLLSLEAAIRAPLEAEVARLNDVLVGIDRDRVSNAYLLREKARRALTPDEGGK